MAKSIEDRLRESNGDYEKAEVKDYRDLPDGVYQAQMTKVKFYESKDGKLKLQMTWKCLVGPEKGGTITDFTPLYGKGVGITKQRLSEAGITLKKLEDLPKYMPVLEGMIASIQITTKTTKYQGKEYTNRNITIKRVVSQDENKPAPKVEDKPKEIKPTEEKKTTKKATTKKAKEEKTKVEEEVTEEEEDIPFFSEAIEEKEEEAPPVDDADDWGL